jgi:WD40 repeat protein
VAKPKGVAWEVAFSPDGTTLAISGGQWEKSAELSLLDLATGELREVPELAKHDHILKGVAISPDGKTLATDCYQSITVWSLEEKRMVSETKNLLKNFVLSLAFSPDGKSLATCGGQMRGHVDSQPGELTIWDTATWKPRTPRRQTEAGGLVGLAYSPDGKWIAAGGYDQALHVWDAETLQSKAIYPGTSG